MSQLNVLQELRASLAFANRFDIAKAKDAYDFIIGEKEEQPTLKVNVAPLLDGIYYVMNDKTLVPVAHLETIDKARVIGVAVKMSDKIATVALHDAADGEEIALTTTEKNGSSEFFRPDFWDAMSDWNGEANTKDYGDDLNPAINLQPGQYIPSLAQLHLILLNIKEVNAALDAVGGSPLREEWYWSSTEVSASSSWGVGFGSGFSYNLNKYNTIVVRPAVAI
jgi:hypothetical protein